MKKLPVAAPVVFGLRQSGVGVAQQGGSVLAVVRVQAGANGGRRAQHGIAHVHALAYGCQQAVCQRLGALAALRCGHHHGKLVARQPRHHVAGRHTGAHTLCHRAQHQVAGSVAQRIVHSLEMVQVQQQHRQLRARLCKVLHSRQAAVQSFEQLAPVGQLGKRVVQRHMRLALLRRLVRAQVAQDGHPVAGAGLVQCPGDDFHRHLVAVAVQHGHFAGLFQLLVHVAAAQVTKTWRHMRQQVLAQQFWQRVAQQPLHRLVAIGDGAVLVEQDGFVGGLGKLAHPLLAQAHGAFGVPVLGDVVDQHQHAALHLLAVQVRQQVDLQHALLTIAQHLFAQVLDLLAPQAARHLGLDGAPGRLANRLACRQADDGVGVMPVVTGVQRIGKAALERANLVVRHQGGHRIGNQAQQRRAFHCLRRTFVHVAILAGVTGCFTLVYACYSTCNTVFCRLQGGLAQAYACTCGCLNPSAQPLPAAHRPPIIAA